MDSKRQPNNVDEYIAGFPPGLRRLLRDVRRAIRAALPGAQETISYQIPAYRLGGRNIVHFAGFKDHIGIYPAPSGTAAFQKQVARYRSGKATLRFRIDRPIPEALVARIATLRAREVAQKTTAKQRSATG